MHWHRRRQVTSTSALSMTKTLGCFPHTCWMTTAVRHCRKTKQRQTILSVENEAGLRRELKKYSRLTTSGAAARRMTVPHRREITQSSGIFCQNGAVTHILNGFAL